MIPYILLFLMILIYFLSFWKIFEKNGRKKWEGLVPIYNIYIWLKIINKPWWWLFFFPIPFDAPVINAVLPANKFILKYVFYLKIRLAFSISYSKYNTNMHMYLKTHKKRP